VAAFTGQSALQAPNLLLHFATNRRRGSWSVSSLRGAAGAGTKHEMDLCMILFVLAIAMVPIVAYGFWLASELGLY
jgi:hypothetical protein